MNYMNQLNTFWRIEQVLNLTPSASYLYMRMLNIYNGLHWAKSITPAENFVKGNLKHGAFVKARKLLINKGLIEYKSRGANRSARYEIFELTDERVQSLFDHSSDHTRDCTSDHSSDRKSDHSSDPYKRRDETNKEKNKEKAAPNKNGAGSLEVNFNKLWKLYPSKKGRKKALESYKRSIKKGVTNKEIQDGIVALIKHTDPKFYPNGSTWFNGERWTDSYDSPEPPRASEPSDFEKSVARQQKRDLIYNAYSKYGNDLDKAMSDIKQTYPDITYEEADAVVNPPELRGVQ